MSAHAIYSKQQQAFKSMLLQERKRTCFWVAVDPQAIPLRNINNAALLLT